MNIKDPAVLVPAFGGAVATGILRHRPEDFVVEEVLGFGPTGAGEHWWLTLTKRGRNTQEVAGALAAFAGVPPVAVGYAGLKDRHAVTTQTFTVQVPGKVEPDWSALTDDTLSFGTIARHDRKLRRGSLSGNRFVITIREMAGDRSAVEQRLAEVVGRGVPNYFGEQRFGRDAQNIARADALLSGRLRRVNRNDRSLWLSAARSHLFNRVLAERVKAGVWESPIEGDVLMFAGSRTQIRYAADDPTLDARIAAGDLHPTGPMPGQASRALSPEGAAAALEAEALTGAEVWLDGLARARVDADRRPCRLLPEALSGAWADDGSLILTFSLDAGSYATTVLGEILDVSRSGSVNGDAKPPDGSPSCAE